MILVYSVISPIPDKDVVEGTFHRPSADVVLDQPGLQESVWSTLLQIPPGAHEFRARQNGWGWYIHQEVAGANSREALRNTLIADRRKMASRITATRRSGQGEANNQTAAAAPITANPSMTSLREHSQDDDMFTSPSR